MNPSANPVALITGAGSGIGQALAKTYAQKGYDLTLLDKEEKYLEETQAACKAIVPDLNALCLTGNVGQATCLKDAYAQTMQKFGRIDVVIANAGFAVNGRFERLEVSDYERQFQTNVMGVLHTIKTCLPALKESKGRIGILGSVNSYISEAGKSAYCMSKFSVRALGESLRIELKEHGISVTLFYPGFVKTKIFKVDKKGQYREDFEDRSIKWLAMHPKHVAQKMFHALNKRKAKLAISNHAKLLITVQRHCPRLMPPLLKLFGI